MATARDRTPIYTDLDPKRVQECADLELGSFWYFPRRDRRGGHHGGYHGNFIPQVAYQLMRRYSRPGDVIVDWFLGGGTTAIEGLRLGRRVIGVELQADQVARVAAELPPAARDIQVHLVAGDAAAAVTAQGVQAALAAWGEERAHLAILHPPYHDIIRFSDDPCDLSNCPDVATFLTRFGQVVDQAVALLADGHMLALVIGDLYRRGEVELLGFRCIDAVRRRGLVLKALNVKNIAGNEEKGARRNLWKYRALAGGFSLFEHEYVAVFVRPPRARVRPGKPKEPMRAPDPVEDGAV